MKTTVAKLLPLSDLVRDHIHNGDVVFVGGFGQNVPFAIGFEIIRQRKRNLTLCRTGADILFDILIAAGCVKRVVVGWIGNPGIGLNHAFSRAIKAGQIELEESSNFGILLRLMAARLGLPYLPTRTLVAGDTAPRLANIRQIRCPFTDEPLMAVAALVPDVAIIHVQRGDQHGNLQGWGILGDSREGALAAKRIVASVEEVVAADTIRQEPERTIVPAYRVQAIAAAPLGSHPSYCEGYYGRDDEFYREYDLLSRDSAKLEEWIERHIRQTGDWGRYLQHLGRARIARLLQASSKAPPQNWMAANDFHA